MKKKRLDARLQQEYPAYSRTALQNMIAQGKASINGVVTTKPGSKVADDAVVTLDTAEQKYVSRAGFKLEAALDHFSINVQNLVLLDAGLSTGGFTDCLLQRGAQRVYGIDVGHGQVHPKIASDERVVVMERTNLRHLESLPEQMDMVTLDVSFISLLTVMPAVLKVLKPGGQILCLIKPQFEAGRDNIRRKGLVSDTKIHEQVIATVVDGMKELGLTLIGNVIASPIQGAASGNTEFLGSFKKDVLP